MYLARLEILEKGKGLKIRAHCRLSKARQRKMDQKRKFHRSLVSSEGRALPRLSSFLLEMRSRSRLALSPEVRVRLHNIMDSHHEAEEKRGFHQSTPTNEMLRGSRTQQSGERRVGVFRC